MNRIEHHPLQSSTTETRRAPRQLPIRARSTPGQSQGRPTTNSGLAAHSVTRRPAQPASPRSPWHPERADATAPTRRRRHSTGPVSSPYNSTRPHRALDLNPPDDSRIRSPIATVATPHPLQVNRRDLLGGLIHEYELAAA